MVAVHQCSFCKDPIPSFDKPRTAHLCIGMDTEGHIHTHGDLERKAEVRQMLDSAAESSGVGIVDKKPLMPKAVVFNNKQRIGDSLMFTCAIRDFKKAFPDVQVGARVTAPHILDHNPYIDRSIDAEAWKKLAMKQVEHLPLEEREKQSIFDLGEGRFFIKIGPGELTNKSNSLDWHFANAYRMSIERHLGVTIPQGESRPDIWLTEEEYNSPRPIAEPYWVICVNGEKAWGCKMYPMERWQAVVDAFPTIKFVQIGTKGDNAPRLQGANVIDMVGKTDDGKTGIRDLFKLFLHAEGSIGLVSFHMHLSGALSKPAVIVAGAREPVSFTRYAGHQYLANDGCLPCATKACWHCDINSCTNLVQTPNMVDKQVPKCVDMIDAEDVCNAIRQYYKGGRLKVGVPSEKPKFKNVVKAAKPAEAKFDWGKGAIDPMDWPFLEEVIKKHQVKTVLEFGAGLSTQLFAEKAGVLTDSFETEQAWIDKVTKEAPNAKIHKWNGRDMLGMWPNNYDLAFVDGPANGQNREQAVRLAANHANIVIMHDATRTYEAQWEEKYLKPGFQGPIKGGRWCHMWIKTASFKEFAAPVSPPPNPNQKRVRIVSTARGWGGCARSITTIMRLLLKAGHSVEFVPFRNAVTSKEMIDILKNELSAVKVTKDYDVLRTPCDVLLMYADDYVWEFPKHPEFEGINADRKIMMLNYRRGGVGEIPWTKGWDKYLFLNSAQESELKAILPGIDTAVYPPCTDLAPFFEAKIDYHKTLTIVRHNSQGDTKFAKDEHNQIHEALRLRPECAIHMLPGPSWMQPTDRFFKHARTGIPALICQFLERGNLFWYSLPKGYMDMGPRVILEAMAAGLPVIADNWGGAVDRVTPDCGWICDSKEQMLEVIKNVTPEELYKKGQAARARALAEFRSERWIDELTKAPCYA